MSETFDTANEVKTAWLGTAASQIFLMQLGFLCYESGYVEHIWTNSIIAKNLQDTFVGFLTYIIFSWTLASSDESFFGFVSIPKNIFLINVYKHVYMYCFD